jgi:hypothetical protein
MKKFLIILFFQLNIEWYILLDIIKQWLIKKFLVNILKIWNKFKELNIEKKLKEIICIIVIKILIL